MSSLRAWTLFNIRIVHFAFRCIKKKNCTLFPHLDVLDMFARKHEIMKNMNNITTWAVTKFTH